MSSPFVPGALIELVLPCVGCWCDNGNPQSFAQGDCAFVIGRHPDNANLVPVLRGKTCVMIWDNPAAWKII